LRHFKGSLGSPAVIRVNGALASVDTPLQNGDSVEFVPGQDGEDARVLVKDLLEDAPGTIFVNGEPITVQPEVYVNGRLAGWDDTVPDRAKVQIISGRPVRELLIKAGVDEDKLYPRT